MTCTSTFLYIRDIIIHVFSSTIFAPTECCATLRFQRMKPLGALIFTRALFLLILILKQTDCDGRVNTQLRHLRRTKRLASGSSALVARQPVRLGSPRNIHYPSSPRLSVWRCSMSSRAQDGVGGGNQARLGGPHHLL